MLAEGNLLFDVENTSGEVGHKNVAGVEMGVGVEFAEPEPRGEALEGAGLQDGGVGILLREQVRAVGRRVRDGPPSLLPG